MSNSKKSIITPPESIEKLWLRAKNLSGKTLADIAKQIVCNKLTNIKNKGYIGQLLELALGAESSNKAEPDFYNLGVELKTIPVNLIGIPKESTYVCTLDLYNMRTYKWNDSVIERKLKHVLWIPISSNNEKNIMHKIVGTPILWKPDKQQLLLLKQDWQELTEMLISGSYDKINANFGQVLQVRPKGRNSFDVQKICIQEGKFSYTMRRGFYLRAKFTKLIIRDYLKFY